MTYLTKPQSIQALQWTGYNLDELQSFVPNRIIRQSDFPRLCVDSPDGFIAICPGDYVIRTPDGLAVPMAQAAFEQRYEPKNLKKFP